MNDAEEHLMTVFSAALDCGSADERQAYLDRACAGDPALRERVEALLRAHGRGGDFLGRAAGPFVGPQERLDPLTDGRVIGAGPVQIRLPFGGRPAVQGGREHGQQVLFGVIKTESPRGSSDRRSTGA